MCTISSCENVKVFCRSSFLDRDEAKLVLDLETVLSLSSKFDLGLFHDTLLNKDNYGNGTVRRTQVLQAAAKSKLDIESKPAVIGAWLKACDKVANGNLSIKQLVSYLERSNPTCLPGRTSSSSATLQSLPKNLPRMFYLY